MWGNSSDRTILIGCDLEYARIQDVVIQTALARPDITIYYSLQELCEAVEQIIN